MMDFNEAEKAIKRFQELASGLGLEKAEQIVREGIKMSASINNDLEAADDDAEAACRIRAELRVKELEERLAAAEDAVLGLGKSLTKKVKRLQWRVDELEAGSRTAANYICRMERHLEERIDSAGLSYTFLAWWSTMFGVVAAVTVWWYFVYMK